MPALNFKKQFTPIVESGDKRQTIRKARADGRDPKTGDTLYLYTGMRTKSCRKLKEVTCISSVPILIDEIDTIVAGKLLSYDEELELAQLDGFKTVTDFRAFFVKPELGVEQFEGKLIKW